MSLARGQLVNPNFAQTIEFSTKFSETPLRKLILLTERLSVEIGNLIPFIYLFGEDEDKFNFHQIFWRKTRFLPNNKSEIADSSDNSALSYFPLI